MMKKSTFSINIAQFLKKIIKKAKRIKTQLLFCDLLFVVIENNGLLFIF